MCEYLIDSAGWSALYLLAGYLLGQAFPIARKERSR